MIKIGVFGLSGETLDLIRQIKAKKENVFIGYSSPEISSGHYNVYLKKIPLMESGDMVRTSDFLIFSASCPAMMPYIRQSLRLSKPVFFIDTFNLPADALKEIVELAREAKVRAACYNPVWFNTVFKKAASLVHKPFFAEFIHRLRPEQFHLQSALNNLLYELEAVLRLNDSFPRKPIINAYSTGNGQVDFFCIHLEFDDGNIALFRYDGISEKAGVSCQLVQTGTIITLDLATGVSRQYNIPRNLPLSKKTVRQRYKINNPLYSNWNHFLTQKDSLASGMEQRLAATRLFQSIREKILNKFAFLPYTTETFEPKLRN